MLTLLLACLNTTGHNFDLHRSFILSQPFPQPLPFFDYSLTNHKPCEILQLKYCIEEDGNKENW